MSDYLDDDDFRAMSLALGPQVAVLPFPHQVTGRWASGDELAGVEVRDGRIRIHTAADLDAATALELAAAIAAYAAHQLGNPPS